jgi:hypothetical protein
MMRASEAGMQVVKVCRECGEEYRPDILRCADCGGELEARYEEERTSWPKPGEAAAVADTRPAGDYQPIAWRPTARELTPLADRLVALAIPFYLRPSASEAGEGAAGYELRVRQEEREAALRELAGFEPVPRIHSADAQGEGETSDCPACGHVVQKQAAECPECGLALGDGEP